MAVGKQIVSAYSGIADPENFGLTFEPPKEKTHKIFYKEKDKQLHKLYEEVRTIRENSGLSLSRLKVIFEMLKDQFPHDWLLPLEMYEIAAKHESRFREEFFEYLKKFEGDKKIAHLIKDGLELINKELKLLAH